MRHAQGAIAHSECYVARGSPSTVGMDFDGQEIAGILTPDFAGIDFRFSRVTKAFI